MRTQPIDSKFWTRFAKTYWERKPLVLRNIQSELLELNDIEVFNLVVRAADRSRRERKLLGFKFYVQGIRSSDEETLFVLPRKNDKSFLGYNERMERMYQDYCLVCDELLQVNREKQVLLKQFTRELYLHVGFPNRFAEMGLYLGNYRKTPFGVHRDPCGVFSFPVVGKKVFRAWTSAYVARNPDLEQSFRYSKHKEASLELEAGPGDLMYWPSSSWHIAESNGSFSATWSLGVWIDRPTSSVVGESLMTLLSEKMNSALSSAVVAASTTANQSGEITKLPDVFDDAITTLKSLTRQDLETTFRTAWMSQLASGGLKTQARQEDSFRVGKSLRLRDVRTPVLWTLEGRSSTDKQTFSFIFGDIGLQRSTSKNLLKLIKDLNADRVCVLDKYLARRSRAEDLRALQLLGSAGAFR